MQWRSCFLYAVGFCFVGVVCIIIAASTVTANNRATSVKHLRALIAEKGAIPEPDADTAEGGQPRQQEEASEPGSRLDAATVQRDFAYLMAQYSERWGDETWKAMFAQFHDHPVTAWSPAEWARFTAFVESQRDYIAAIRRTASSGHPLVALERPLTYDTSLEYLATARGMARLLAMDAVVAGRAGDGQRIITDMDACLGLAQDAADVGCFHALLSAISIASMVHQALGDGVAPGSLDARQTAALVDVLAEAYGQEAFTAAVAGEAALGLGAYDTFRNAEFPDRLDDELGFYLYGSALLSPVFNHDQSAYAETMEAFIAAAQQPYYVAHAEIERLQAEIAGGFPFLRFASRVLTPDMTSLLADQARNVAQVDLMRMGLLLELRYAETGRYPDSLDAIAGELGGAVPVDPFTGEAYRYLPQGDTMQLYSTGLNGTDDGGVHQWEEGDWVWRGRKAE